MTLRPSHRGGGKNLSVGNECNGQRKDFTRVINTDAVTGAADTLSMSDFEPITPRKIAADAVKIYEDGVAIAHIHAQNPETSKPNSHLNVFRKVVTICVILLCLVNQIKGI